MTPLLTSSSGARLARRVRPTVGFTLIELLTVIAIIGILAAILLPVVGKVRRTASSAQCASHMRQIGMSVQLYTEDNKGRLPMPTNQGGDFHSGQGPWFDPDDRRLQYFIGSYLGSPKAAWNKPWAYDEHFAWPAFLASSSERASSVLLNRKVEFRDTATLGSPWAGKGTPVKVPRPLADIVNPSTQAVFTEVDQMNTTAGWKNLCPPEPVHGAYRNTLFFDWHVAKVPLNG